MKPDSLVSEDLVALTVRQDLSMLQCMSDGLEAAQHKVSEITFTGNSVHFSNLKQSNIPSTHRREDV